MLSTRNRLVTVATVALALAAAALPAAATAASADPGSAQTAEKAVALPTVDMERVLIAAQLDPYRTDDVTTPGAKASVLRVERALRAEAGLAPASVDGYFGTATLDAWHRWELKVHPASDRSPAVMNSFPGFSELRDLGRGRFTLERVVESGGWTTEDGEKVDGRTKAMFHKAEDLSGNMRITQGWGDAPASDGTHLGGGVIDISVRQADGSGDLTQAQIDARVGALRTVGFAAWFRDWAGNRHIHAVAISDPFLPVRVNRVYCQTFEFKFFDDGLGGCTGRPSDANSRNLTTWEEYKRAH